MIYFVNISQENDSIYSSNVPILDQKEYTNTIVAAFGHYLFYLHLHCSLIGKEAIQDTIWQRRSGGISQIYKEEGEGIWALVK